VIKQDVKRDVKDSAKHSSDAVRCATEQFQQCYCQPGHVIYYGDKFANNGSNHILSYREMLNYPHISAAVQNGSSGLECT